MIYKTKKEAVERMVEQLDAVETAMIQDLIDNVPDCYCDELTVRTDDDYDYDSQLPMWKTMWSFHSNMDYWLQNSDGFKKMSECGFRIYDIGDYGYFFGIDGAGYDFYEAHWEPLYDALGLCWHNSVA